jgi:hypothetical protein
MHWGTFILTDEPLTSLPSAELRTTWAGVSAEHFFLMKHGETRKLALMMAPRRIEPAL